MVLKHFQLERQPFGATPDARFLFATDSHREALASLYCGFYANRGFTALIAEPGMGKTTLLFEFIDHIAPRARTALVFESLCNLYDALFFILRDLGIQPSERVSEWHFQLKELLISEASVGRQVVVVLDEAQNLSIETLEAIRLLTNFETRSAKLMQIILAGQQQLALNLEK